jgi:hypothetical protein
MNLTYASIGQRGAMNDTSMLYHAWAGSPSSVFQRVSIFSVNLVGVIYSISNICTLSLFCLGKYYLVDMMLYDDYENEMLDIYIYIYVPVLLCYTFCRYDAFLI